MSPHYRHTQIGWVIIGSVLVAIVLAGWQVPASHVPWPAALVLGVVALLLALFTTLTAEVDAHELRVHFTLGLIHKRVPLAGVQQVRVVRNPWWCGWGIRMLPNGQLWNVSGLGAAELLLREGRVFRVGSDEPEALARAIEQVVGRAAVPKGTSGTDQPAGRRSPWFAPLIVAAVLVGTPFALAPFYLQMRPPTVTVTPQALRIDCLFYGESYPMAEVTAVSLEPRLPPILARTNGFAAAGTLRGRFRLAGLGEGKLFVEQGSSPYLFVRLRRGFLFVNFEAPEKTRALFEEIRGLWTPASAADAVTGLEPPR